MKNMNEIRQKAYKECPEVAAITDFLTQNESKLKKLHRQFKKDTGEKMLFIQFVYYVFHEAQDLIINPQQN